jgi:hypothetical protein
MKDNDLENVVANIVPNADIKEVGSGLVVVEKNSRRTQENAVRRWMIDNLLFLYSSSSMIH